MRNIIILYNKVKASLILLICGISVAFFVSCSADDTEYTRNYRCYFTFNTSIHNTSLILSCVNPMSKGMFCMAWQEMKGEVRHIKVQLSDGKTVEDNAITTAIEARQQCIMGAGNGLIIGRSSLIHDELYIGQLYAFDRLCPNCLDQGISKQMQWDHNGQWVKCPRCLRSYNLNNSGYVESGESGKKLMRYHSSYNGTALVVTN